ncbi:hypothetical protein ERJ75_000262500 [Trypanosoma vivax]|nr:hypothetical protein ERJ75_000262500 [Trypanosoma vivax]
MRKCEDESNHSCVTVFECVVPFVGAAGEEVWLTVDAVHGAVASFDETGREAGHVGELMRIRERRLVACEVEERSSIVRQFFIALKSIAVDALGVARELKERVEVTSGRVAAYGVAGNITLGGVEGMCSTASRVAVNATDALSRCYPLPRTFAQPRPEVQDVRLCEQDVASGRAVLVRTTEEHYVEPSKHERVGASVDGLVWKISECWCGNCAQVRDVEHDRGLLQLPCERV